MTFNDVPADIRSLSLTDPRLAADVIDLIIGDDARSRGCVGLMLCDGQDRGVQPVVLADVPAVAESDVLRQILGLFLPGVAEEGGSVLVGRGRPGGSAPNDLDREWLLQAIDCCTASGVRLLGFHLATSEGVFPLPGPLSAAS